MKEAWVEGGWGRVDGRMASLAGWNASASSQQFSGISLSTCCYARTSTIIMYECGAVIAASFIFSYTPATDTVSARDFFLYLETVGMGREHGQKKSVEIE